MSRFTLILLLLLAGVKAGSQTPDTIPPFLSCKSQVAITISPICLATLFAVDLADSVSDASMPVQLGVRRICTGDGFPQKDQQLFSVADLGLQKVELWAKDAAGNTQKCLANVIIQDVMGNCDPGLSVTYRTPLNAGIDSVHAKIFGYNCLANTFDRELFSGTPSCCSGIGWGVGYYGEFGSIAPAPGYETSITPRKNDQPLNGVTTYDLALISQHILGLEALDSPYKIIAADANQDGKVTTFDIIVLRKLILGITSELPNGKSWRFLPDNYVFPNPQDPFTPPFPEKILVPHSADPLPTYFQFTGVKIGDVNDSAFPGG
jgi:hypothetical protein